MSVINQMLQDLDARGKKGQPVASMPSEVRAVSPPARSQRLWFMVLGLALVLLILVLVLASRQNAGVGVTPMATPPAPVTPRRAVAVVAPAPPPARMAAPVSPPANAQSSTGTEPVARTMPTSQPDGPPAAVSAAVPGAGAIKLKLIPELASLASPHAAPSAGQSDAMDTPRANPSQVTGNKAEPAHPPTQVATRVEDVPVESGKPVDHGIKLVRQPLTPQQRAENEYRKAVQARQQGRLADAMAGLELALQLDIQHTGARQTLVAWLLEQGKRSDAVHRLQEGLAHDPGQAGLAMILARLQVDEGDVKSALETLQKSLPYTLERADYQAFLAALWQREGRHKDAIRHYQIALQLAPDNGVWWMGLGISLQAEQQRAAAREAYQRAKVSGLTAELSSFVDQRLNQL